MKVNFLTALVDVNGKEMISETGAPVTLKDVATAALVNHKDGELNTMTGADKFKLYSLALKINNTEAEGLVNLTLDELTTIKERIGMIWGAGIVGPAWIILEKE